MGTLASELSRHAARISGVPRVYVDANMPAGVVAFMRLGLGWDTLFVVEHDDLRRAPDREHFRFARHLSRTLITLDRDYLDDRRFPPDESGGVVVLSAPGEHVMCALLRRLDLHLFRGTSGSDALPLEGRKVKADVDWPAGGTMTMAATAAR